MELPAIRYAKTRDGLNIAYQVVGDGPSDLVFVPEVTSNIEIFWENPGQDPDDDGVEDRSPPAPPVR